MLVWDWNVGLIVNLKIKPWSMVTNYQSYSISECDKINNIEELIIPANRTANYYKVKLDDN